MGTRTGTEVPKAFEFGWAGVVEVFDALSNGLLVGEFLVPGCKSDFGAEGQPTIKWPTAHLPPSFPFLLHFLSHFCPFFLPLPTVWIVLQRCC